MYTKFLYTKERDQYLKHIKQAVADGEEVLIPNEYRYLVQEWKRSISAGVSHTQNELPESTRDMQTFERVSDFDKFRLAYMDEYYTRRDEAIGSLGCAIYYMDKSMSVYRKSGNAKMLARLRERGLRLGSTLSVKNVGVFAANMASEFPDQVICRVGSENYMELFSEFACFAHYWYDEYRDTCGIILAVLPAEECEDREQNIINFLLKVEDVTHEIYYPFSKKRSDYLDAWAYDKMTLELFIDEQGEVVFASRLFEDTFGKKISFGLPPTIAQFMPELSYLTKFFDEDRNPCQSREIMLLTAEKKHGFFVAVPEIFHMRDGKKGLHCLLQYSGKKKTSNPAPSGKGAEIRYSFASIIGGSQSMARLKEYAVRTAENDSNVLILGESGTGKELFAQALHSASKKKNGPFVPINCAALPKDLLNSELFGYEEGAFTGALKGGAPGKFEQANGGTIFLDEIGDMPLDMQSALLRVLEDNTIIRVGGRKYIPVDIRVIAATNQDLWKNVQMGSFRADLYFRLNIVTLRIPPLRERRDDIAPLAEDILERIQSKYGGTRYELAPELIELFKGYDWPGNVRELRNVVERCVNYSQSRLVTPEQIPEELMSMLKAAERQPESGTVPPPAYAPAADNWRGYDRERVVALMRKHGGNKTKAARELGISRATFYKRLREFGLD